MKWLKPNGLVIYSTVTVDLDHAILVNRKEFGDIAPKVIEYDELNTLCLDPGGMYFYEMPWLKFSIEDYNFSIQRYNIKLVKDIILSAKEFESNNISFRVAPDITVIMSSRLGCLLLEKLKELESEDATIHEDLDTSLIKSELNKHKNILLNIKKENPDGKIS